MESASSEPVSRLKPPAPVKKTTFIPQLVDISVPVGKENASGKEEEHVPTVDSVASQGFAVGTREKRVGRPPASKKIPIVDSTRKRNAAAAVAGDVGPPTATGSRGKRANTVPVAPSAPAAAITHIEDVDASDCDAISLTDYVQSHLFDCIPSLSAVLGPVERSASTAKKLEATEKRLVLAKSIVQSLSQERVLVLDKAKAVMESVATRDAVLSAQCESLEKSCKSTQQALAGAQKELDDNKAELRAVTSNATRLASQLSSTELELGRLTRERYVLVESHTAAVARVKEAEATIAAMADEAVRQRHEFQVKELELMGKSNTDFAAQEIALTAARGEVCQTKQALQSKEVELHTAQGKLLELTRSVEYTQSQLTALTAANAALTAEKNAVETHQRSLMAELAGLKERHDNREDQLATTITSFSKMQDKHAEKEADWSRERAVLAGQLTDLQSERDRLKTSELELQSRVRELGSELSRAHADSALKQAQLDIAVAAANETRGEALKFQLEMERVRAEMAMLTSSTATTKEDLEAKLEAVSSRRAVLEEKLKDIRTQLDTYEQQLEQARQDAIASAVSQKDLENRLTSAMTELSTLKESAHVSDKDQLAMLCAVSSEADTLRRRMIDMERLSADLATAMQENAALKAKVYEGEMARRKLHNVIQELRGNIRVFVRVRPPLPSDAEAAGSVPPMTCSADGKNVTMIVPPSVDAKAATFTTAAGGRDTKKHSFEFDSVFGQASTQPEVFESVSDLVQSALDGYQVCIFSYGQTGAGKTWTMQGGPGDAQGIIPRAVNKILEVSTDMAEQGWLYELSASFVEIYQENIRDLLRATSDPNPPKLNIQHGRTGTVSIPDVTQTPIVEVGDVDTLMAKAARSKAVAATMMNAQSSRSHCVFTLTLIGRNASRGVEVRGALNLCDLAGSERLSKSQAEGVTMKEAQAINKSLSSLVDVFNALQKKSSHIPFRNSKLTDLLQPCFSGDGKVLMIVNLSPTPSSAGESLCSLRFAQQASQIEMGKPTRRVQDLTGGEGTSTDEPSDAAVDVDDVSMDVDTELIAKPSVKAPVAASGKTPGTVPSKAGVTATAVKPRPMLKK